MKIYRNVLIEGHQHFGSGCYRASCDLRGGQIVPGTQRTEYTSFVEKVYADVQGTESPVTKWADIFRPQRTETYFAEGEGPKRASVPRAIPSEVDGFEPDIFAKPEPTT